MKPYEKLQKFWQVTGSDIVARKPDETEIQSLEQRYGIRFPDDFREYLCFACPAEDDTFDDHTSTWWPVARIKNIPDEYDHKISDEAISRNAANYIFFADYSIWCCAWAICCDESESRGKVALIGGSPDRLIADSFAEFIDLYVRKIPPVF